MIPLKCLAFEDKDGENREDGDGKYLLNYLKLHQCEGTTIAIEADTVAVYLANVLGKGKEPRGQNDENQRSMVRNDPHCLQLQMAIPGKSHETITDDQQSNGKDYTTHFIILSLSIWGYKPTLDGV